jgi:DNA mismatch endonuclease (patch repair protein)
MLRSKASSVDPARSAIMSAIRSTNTRPEMRVRKALHKMGYRFRLHVRSMPGNPDIVLPKYRTIFMVNGCFWHRHKCKNFRVPASNLDYWQPKLAGNSERDQINARKLRRLGWTVRTIWECRLKVMSQERLECELQKQLSGARPRERSSSKC